MKKIFFISIFILLLHTFSSNAQSGDKIFLPTDSTSVSDKSVDTLRITKVYSNISDIEIHFRHDSHILDLKYMGNNVALQRFEQTVDSIGINNIDSIVVVSHSSPEGAYNYNLKLSQRRANTMKSYIHDNYPDIAHLLKEYADGESWGKLREYVVQDTLMKNSTIQKVLDVIDADVSIDTKKWRIQRLPIYRYLLTTYYPRIRNSMICIIYHSQIIEEPDTVTEIVEPITKPVEELPVQPDTVVATVDTIPAEEPLPEMWTRHIYVKTNAVSWGMAISNIAGEVDLAPHWSIALPIYYSAWNYFKPTLKFRTFAIQPEARYWLKDVSEGFYVGAHVAMTYYNFAFDGDLRYQDHNGCAPAWGGGLNLGYRLPLEKTHRWHVEFSLGAGVHSLYYDTFHNVDNGRLIDTYRDTYWGIDQVGITFSYRFNLDKHLK